MHSPPTKSRSRNMAAIGSKDTKPELYVRRRVHAAGFRFRLHRRDLAGRPDLVLPRYRIAVFVNGCFWHGHDCQRGHRPRSNTAYWQPKIAANVARDQRNVSSLAREGWEVTIVRECTLEGDTENLILRLEELRNPRR
ncbi:MAG: very short patch repair endonuclease [Chloroflexi bacterium]|nr:very short patch repair endonuclease [Chloroflexota bacterium]MCY3588212.1 very short patch repair endonuclease [Chloroflexota bacterium]MCY3685761.1 very short patch repair endonuclease [Chloroflexota bacterium]MDE2709251.1 very short patch repair endonuclease [Chloroflexota bacterium]